MNTKELINEAVSLPVEDRALVVDTLLRSLNQPESDIDKKWALTAKQRLDEIKNGKADPVPGEKDFNHIWDKFNKQ